MTGASVYIINIIHDSRRDGIQRALQSKSAVRDRVMSAAATERIAPMH